MPQDKAELTDRLSSLWKAPARERLPSTSLGISGGLWSLPSRQRLEVPALEQMRVIVNLHPVARHEFWSDGRQRRSAGSPAGALRIAPMHERATAQVRGDAFKFAQIYIPKTALFAIDGPSLAYGTTSAFRDPGFDAVDPLVAELVKGLLAAGTAPDETLYRDHLALALLAHLDRRYGEVSRTPSAAGALDARRLSIALECLHEAEETPTLAQISALVGMSVHHFARSFKSATGLAPHAYLRNLRVERAKRLMATTTASITAIALDCGYATPSAFTAAFTRSVGESPSVWRRRRLR